MTPSSSGREGAAIPAQVVIVSNRDGDGDVYSIRADGRRAGAVTRNRVVDRDVVLSPAGGWIVLSRPLGLVLVHADGRRESRLGASTYAPAFSPSGRSLAFARETDPLAERRRIELVDVGTPRAARKLGSGDPIRFSADGRRLAYGHDGGVGVLDVASGRRTVVATSARLGDAFPTGEDWSPQLSGFVIERDHQELRELVYVASTPGARPRVLMRDELGLSRAWLDDHRLGYDRGLADGQTELIVDRVDRNERRVIARGAIGFAHWAPSGAHVAYTVRGGRAVVIASTTTTLRRTIQVGQEVRNMSWSPSGRRLALMGAVGDPTAAALVVVEPRSGTVVRRLVGSGGSSAWSPDETALASIQPAGVSVFDLRSGRSVVAFRGGDTQVVGWLRHPQSPTVPLAPAAPPTELASATGFRSRTEVREIAADGVWVGALLAAGPLDREHVAAWTPTRQTTVRFAGTSPEGGYGSYQRLSLRDERLRWTWFFCGNDCYLADCTADVRRAMRQSCGQESPTEDRPPPAPRPPAETRRGVAVSVRGGVVELRGAGGRSRTIRPPGRLADAELEDAGLFYAYNTSGPFPGRVVFVRFAELLP